MERQTRNPNAHLPSILAASINLHPTATNFQPMAVAIGRANHSTVLYDLGIPEQSPSHLHPRTVANSTPNLQHSSRRVTFWAAPGKNGGNYIRGPLNNTHPWNSMIIFTMKRGRIHCIMIAGKDSFSAIESGQGKSRPIIEH